MTSTDPIFVILPISGPQAPDPFRNPGIVPPWLREPVPPKDVGGGAPRFRDCGFTSAGLDSTAGVDVLFDVDVDATRRVQTTARASDALAVRRGYVHGQAREVIHGR